MFDTKISSRNIKKRYSYQAVKKLNDQENEKNEYTIIKDCIKKYDGHRHFAKIIKINTVKYILMYFNNEQELFKATYDSAMNKDLSKGLQIKKQNELIGKDGFQKAEISKDTYKQRTDSFGGLTIYFSNRIEKISGKEDSASKGKERGKVVESEIEQLNENNKA
ncbi:hypothetical protein RhiirA5_430557 [Rhizophagus irregularis]|uniref:Uncharacterized protein n=1 Tax=Rhizophagus irregularis TaxID=588596 RepID=A0A2N0R5F6_9GLOM|nr:hypothetical protein RhiirA5_431753 [Rhizophagus irregularis]PKB98938.1 hypothetical protein RhiirA5_430557 [Rhizophagus irregularis]PKC58545.1 hypothetical protein RhiirA1_470801 [Rhizophagus irregularis]